MGSLCILKVEGNKTFSPKVKKEIDGIISDFGKPDWKASGKGKVSIHWVNNVIYPISAISKILNLRQRQTEEKGRIAVFHMIRKVPLKSKIWAKVKSVFKDNSKIESFKFHQERPHKLENVVKSKSQHEDSKDSNVDTKPEDVDEY